MEDIGEAVRSGKLSLSGQRLLVVGGLITTFLIFMLVPVALGRQTPRQETFASDDGREAGVAGLVTAEDGLQFTLHTPLLRLNGKSLLSAPGLEDTLREPGSPAIPYFSALIVVPPEAELVVRVSEMSVAELDGIDVKPVPSLGQNAASGISTQGLLDIDNSAVVDYREPDVYQKDAFYPKESFRISRPAYFRGLRLARLELFPIRYNPATGQMAHVRQMDVVIDFEGSTLRAEPSTAHGEPSSVRGIAGKLLNPEQIELWRSLPADFAATTTTLPLGKDLYRIEVNRDGIYEVTYDDLSAAGMNVSSVDPATFEMQHRGDAVAYEFVGNDDGAFEPGEKLRFYGWAFAGNSHERQFVGNNVFWLWAEGSPTAIPSVSAPAAGPEIHTFQSTVTTGPEQIWWPGYSDRWHLFPNDPDPWFWDITTAGFDTVTKTYNVALPNPVAEGGEAKFTAEFGSRDGIGSDQLHTVTVSMNGLPLSSTLSWTGERNVNVTGTVPLTALIDGQNSFQVDYSTDGFSAIIALNRISVSYERRLRASADQLAFTDSSGGQRQLVVGGFQQSDLDQLFAWDVSDPRIPLRILTGTMTVGGSGPYTLTIPTDRPADSSFLLTTAAKALTPEAITQYEAAPLDPPGGAEWVVVTHKDFLAEANRLAQHRQDANHGGLRTHVVEVDDILNQYGYGLPLPSAIQDYLMHALATWPVAPGYVTLLGDATLDPRGVMDTWPDKQYVPTDLVFADRWQGQIPSDLTYSLLVGDDLVPDIAVGRIPAQSVADAAIMIDKIIRFEQNQLQSFSWMENLLFVSDDADSAGNFCLENQAVAGRLPDSLNPIQLCLDDYPDVNSLTETLFAHTSVTGTAFVNYRGHGAISSWGGAPRIIWERHVDDWDNPLKPFVVITGDCLDGHFAYPPAQGLGEVFLKANGVASAAHLGSAGFGYSTEHSALIESFYHGVFLDGLTAIGDAVNYAKFSFALANGHPSILHGFSLQGDPAMQLMRPDLALSAEAQPGHAARDDSVDIKLAAANHGPYPSSVVVSNTLPVGLSYVTATSSISAGITAIGRNILFDLQFGDGARNKGLPRNAVAFITITAQVDHDAESGVVTNLATISGAGLESVPGDERVALDIAILERILYLPAALKS